MNAPPITVKEFISQRLQWEELPSDIQECVGSEKEYYEQVRMYCFEHRIPYEKSGLARFHSEIEYYEKMVTFLQKNLLLYPYKFSTFMKDKLRIMPFEYYLDMLTDIMRAERSYDTLPNFTAADVNRLIGVSRNEYIDIINKARSRKWMWKISKTNTIKELLPKEVIPTTKFDYWWMVEYVDIPQQEFIRLLQNLNEEEQRALGLLKRDGGTPCGRFKKSVLLSLYRKNLIFFNVPVEAVDYIMVPTLSNFIMNRKPTDYYERVVYDILVTIDERTTLLEISNILDVDLEIVKSAVSLCLRNRFALKKMEVPIVDDFLDEWEMNMIQYHETLATKSKTWERLEKDRCKKQRVAYIFDNSLTAHLMFGNLGQEIKRHAVTLFEIGKITDEALDDFIKQLDTVKTPDSTIGEAQVYYKHAISLRHTLRFLRNNSHFEFDEGKFDGGLDMLRCESLKHLDAPTKLKILKTNYKMILTQAPLRSDTPLPIGMPHFFGPPLVLMNSLWFRLYLYSKAKTGPRTLVLRKGTRVRKLPDCFTEGERITFINWDMGEPSFVKSNMVIQTVNESLLFGPVVLQVLKDNSDGSKPTTIKVVFPLSKEEDNYEEEIREYRDVRSFRLIKKKFYEDEDDDENSKKDGEEEFKKEKTEEELELEKVLLSDSRSILKMMKIILKEMHLFHSFGVVKFLKVSKKVNGKNKNGYLPFGIDFGIPLEDDRMNRMMCENISKKEIFKLKNVNAHDLDMKQLAQDFIAFLDHHIDYNFSLDVLGIYPTRNLFFDGEKFVNWE